MNYKNKLLDPRWQKKRLEILNRDNWKCSECGARDKTLHVHHLEYTVPDPWDELDENLETLCETCHKIKSLNFDFSDFKTKTRQKYDMFLNK